MIKRLTRGDLVRAFSDPSFSRKQTMEIVTRYMGNSTVPPAWSYAGVLGTFGKKVARLWAKKLRHRSAGVYRDQESGRWLHPIVQTVYDFGTTPEKLRDLMADVKLQPSAEIPKAPFHVFMDEYYCFTGDDK